MHVTTGRAAAILAAAALLLGSCSRTPPPPSAHDIRPLPGVPYAAAAPRLGEQVPPVPGPLEKDLGLQRCIEIALANNRQRPASRLAMAIAEAQHGQALAAYWPQIAATGSVTRLDECPNYIFPPSQLSIPLLPFPVDVPAQETKHYDRDFVNAEVSLAYLLFDGGQRSALRRQTRAGIEAARQEVRRTDLQVVYDVRRMYSGALLARQVQRVGADTLTRMNVTLELTEKLFKEGAGKVKKTDYLRNKVAVEGLRSMVAVLDRNEKLARAALVNSMGLPWDTELTLPDAEVPFEPLEADLAGLVGDTYRLSPDWARMAAGLEAAEAAASGARSGYFPRVAFSGSLHRMWNDYEYGMATDENKKGWSISLGAQLPLFDGLLTRNRVLEARARLEQLRHQSILLREGLALQVKDVFLGLIASARQRESSGAAMKAAAENRDLTMRAYRQEMLETKDVIEAQMLEALMSAQYHKALFDHAQARARLELIVGGEIRRTVEAAAEGGG